MKNSDKEKKRGTKNPPVTRGKRTDAARASNKAEAADDSPTPQPRTSRRRPKRPSATQATRPAPSHEAISRKAYDLWERDGRPEGNDVTYWLDAERMLMAAPATPETPEQNA